MLQKNFKAQLDSMSSIYIAGGVGSPTGHVQNFAVTMGSPQQRSG